MRGKKEIVRTATNSFFGWRHVREHCCVDAYFVTVPSVYVFVTIVILRAKGSELRSRQRIINTLLFIVCRRPSRNNECDARERSQNFVCQYFFDVVDCSLYHKGCERRIYQYGEWLSWCLEFFFKESQQVGVFSDRSYIGLQRTISLNVGVFDIECVWIYYRRVHFKSGTTRFGILGLKLIVVVKRCERVVDN